VISTPSSGCWPMRSWRRLRSRRSRRETSKPGTPAGSRSSPAAGAEDQRTVRLPRGRATPSHPTTPAHFGHSGGSRLSVAGLASPLRQGSSPTRVSARLSRRRYRGPGGQPQEDPTPLARRRSAGTAAAKTQTPRHLDRATDGKRRCTQPGMGGGLPVRCHHRRAVHQDGLDHRRAYSRII